MAEVEEKTAPDAYGQLRVVCSACGFATGLQVDFQERVSEIPFCFAYFLVLAITSPCNDCRMRQCSVYHVAAYGNDG